MAISILTKGAKSYPMLFCDHCSKKILNPDMANALWPTPRNPEDYRTEVKYVHRECDNVFERMNPLPGNCLWSAMPLNLFLLRLEHNCGFAPGQAQREKEGHDQVGW